MYRFMDAISANPDLLTDVPITEGGVALDLGAYVGNWSLRMSERYGCTVYAFEPSPGPAAKAADRLRAYPRVTVMAVAVGGANGDATLNRDGPGSSIVGGKGAFGSVSVPVRDIVDLLEELELDHVDVMKINIEGAEYDLFDRLVETGWLPRIGAVSIQFHEWPRSAHRRRRRIRAALRQSHDRVWSYGWVWELWVRRDPPAFAIAPLSGRPTESDNSTGQ